MPQSDEKKQTEETAALEMDKFIFTLPNLMENNKLIRIAPSKLHGHGMFATCKIAKGTIICAEKAMLVLPDYAKQRQTFYLKQQFVLLSDAQKNIFKSLSCKALGTQINNDTIKLLNIWQCNKIILHQRKASAIFATLSRINHACLPHANAHWVWNDKQSKQQLIALKDIDKEREILVNYCEELMPSKQRKLTLSKRWAFECQCGSCSDDRKLDKMDKIILEYQAMDKSLESMLGKPLDGYKCARKIVGIVEKHFDANPDLLSKHCYDAGQFALGLQKWSEASFYLETSIKEKMIAYGPEVEMDADVMEKVNMLPTKFRSRFRKFDPKYRAKLEKKMQSKVEDDNDEKEVKVQKESVKMQNRKTIKKKNNNAKKAKKKGKNNQKKKKKTKK